ncbi:MAG TPA: hypothetical protein VIL48_13650 [Acidimicrobiales bacterium]
MVETAAGRWGLAGDVPAGLEPGAEVEVTGRPAAGADAGTGLPILRVTAVRRL